MLEQKEYVAIADFLLNLDNGKNTVNVKRGDAILFDGLTAEFGGVKGQAHSLVKVIGEWIVPKNGKGVATRNTRAPMNSRNITGGKIIENSNVEADPEVKNRKKDDYSELQELLIENEKSQKTKVTDNMQDIRREVKIINEDATIVGKVTQTDSTGVKNTSGVELAEQKDGKRLVISSEERVAKATNYDGKQNVAATTQKRLPVEKDGDGVEVRKVTSTAAPVKVSSGKPTISREEDAVMETSYDNGKHTDVKSSTQRQVEAPKSTKRVVQKAAVSKPETTRIVRPAIEVQEQDAVVVRKVSRDNKLDLAGGTVSAKEDGSITVGGITSRVTVGAPSDMDVGDVSIGGSGDMELGEVEIGSSEATASDVGGEDSDININDILDKA